jgi:hypothetical protein
VSNLESILASLSEDDRQALADAIVGNASAKVSDLANTETHRVSARLSTSKPSRKPRKPSTPTPSPKVIGPSTLTTVRPDNVDDRAYGFSYAVKGGLFVITIDLNKTPHHRSQSGMSEALANTPYAGAKFDGIGLRFRGNLYRVRPS